MKLLQLLLDLVTRFISFALLIITYEMIFGNLEEYFRVQYDIIRQFQHRYDTINARKCHALGYWSLISFIFLSSTTSVSDSVCNLISLKIILRTYFGPEWSVIFLSCVCSSRSKLFSNCYFFWWYSQKTRTYDNFI